MKMPIFLDYQSTTPVIPQVFEKMSPFFKDVYGNPHSNFHQYGTDASDAVESSRLQLGESIGANPEEIIFCSGATEANNFAITRLHKIIPKCRSVITLVTEHKCVLESCNNLDQSISTNKLTVNSDGLLDLNLLEDALKKHGPSLVSIMFVNNETGVIQNIEKISDIVHSHDSLLHTDGAQAIGKLNIDVRDLQIDAMSISGHKFYGPKGIGAIYINRDIKNEVEPLIHGGGQEFKLRSGTVPTPLVVGMAEASDLVNQDLAVNHKKVDELKSRFLEVLKSNVQNLTINGCQTNRVVHNLNIRIQNVEAEQLIINTPGVAFSSGSACSSGEIQSSHVLRGMGHTDLEARESFRVSFSHLQTNEEIENAAEQISESANKIILQQK